MAVPGLAAGGGGADDPVDPRFRLAPSADLNEPGKKKASNEAQESSKRALVAMNKGDLETAKKEFLKVLEQAPDNVPTLINLGLCEYRKKNFAEAETRLRRR